MTGAGFGLLALTVVACAVALYRLWLRLRPLRAARSVDRFDQPRVRLFGMASEVGLHRRLLRLRLSGVLHLMIFVSFIVLVSAIVEDFGTRLVPGFSLSPVGGETWIAALQDIFALVMLAGVGLAAYNRYVLKPARFQGSNAHDATVILILIVVIVVAMEAEFAFRIAGRDGGLTLWRPVSSLLAIGVNSLRLPPERGAETAFWIHVTAILAFLIYVPGSKHLHILVGMPNIAFRSLGPKGVLPAPRPAPEPPAARKPAGVLDLTWKDMLDLYACTECGRCQAACPAHAAGLPLSPKVLIMDLRDHLVEVESGRAKADQPLTGPVIHAETLWACTTCRACMEACPLHIEHVPKIVDMRRDLVDEGAIEPMLQDALGSLQQTGNSFKKPARQRAKWTTGLNFKIPDARKTPVDLLWFVGDFASYDARAQKISRTVATILQRSGVDFGLLYEGEQNSGNDVRRVGDEGLFRMLAEHNIDLLSSASFRRIMTTDPHSLNALRQEYRTLGAEYEVLHYTQVLDDLLSSGQLPFEPAAPGTIVTYHDPCYLGRYNGGFEAPRQLLKRLGYVLHDMPRSRENSFCCGAGGGRIWMDDSASAERPSENRIREALALGDATLFVVACPKDLVMYSAAVQALGVGDRISVKDVGELVSMALAPTKEGLPA